MAVAPAPRWWLAGLLALSGLALAPATAAAQGPTAPPLEARVFLGAPRAAVTYSATSPATPVTIVVQLRNGSGAPVTTRAGFSRTELSHRVYLTRSDGAILTHLGEARVHRESQPLHCFSRRGVIQRPTALPVVPLEILPGPPMPFFREEVIQDARREYRLARPGRYVVTARIPLQTFDARHPGAVLGDCDFFGGPVGNLESAGQRGYTVVSNSLEFVIQAPPPYRVVFDAPLVDNAACPGLPCPTFRLGPAVPLRFRILDANGETVPTATGVVAVEKEPWGPPPVAPYPGAAGLADPDDGRFRFDPATGQYVFNRRTRGLPPGVWRVDVRVAGDRVYSTRIGLRD